MGIGWQARSTPLRIVARATGAKATGQLDGKIAIITGAGTGIGKGIAIAFATEGASLVIASRNRDDLDRTADEPTMTREDIAAAALTMAALPPYANMLEAIVLPVGQAYIGRG